MDPSAFIQEYWQIRSDDSVGLNSDTGWAAAENTGATIGTGLKFRVRIKVRETAAGNESKAFKLQCRRNTGSWEDVNVDNAATGIGPVVMFASDQYAHLDATSSELLTSTAATYVNGAGITTANLTTAYTYDTEETEFEFCLMIMSTFDGFVRNVESDTIELRMVESGGTAFVGTYSYPIITVTETPGYIGGTYPETPGLLGPYKDGNDNLYVCLEPSTTISSNRPGMMKSTNGGDTWREMDGTNRPTQTDVEGFEVKQVGDTLHLLQHKGGNIYYHTFRTSDHSTNADTWGITDESVSATTGYDTQNCALEVRSDGTVVAFWADSDGTNLRVYYKIRSTGGTWGSSNNLDDTASTSIPMVATVKGESDLIYIFYKDDTNGVLYYKTLNASDTLSGRTSVATGMITAAGNNDDYCTTVPVYYDDGGVEVIMIGYQKASDEKVYTRTLRDGTLQTEQGPASDNTVEYDKGANHQLIADTAADSATKVVYLLYSDTATLDMYTDKNTDEGGWGTDTELLDAKTVHWIRSQIYTYSSGETVQGIYYDNGSANNSTGLGWYYERFLYGSISAEQPAYISGTSATPISSEQPSYIRGHVAISTEQPAFISGPATPISTEQPAYIAGIGSTSLEQPAYINGTTLSISAEQPAYINGSASVPISFSNLGASANPDINDNGGFASYSNTSWAPPSSGLIVVCTHSRRTGGPDTPSVSGNNLTWVQIGSALNDNDDGALCMFAADASGSTTGATTFDFGANVQTHFTASFFLIENADLSGGVAAAFVQRPSNTGTAATSGSVTLAAAADSNNRPISYFWHWAEEASTPRTDWTELDDLAGAGRVRGIITQYRDDAFETTASASWTTSVIWAGIAAEIKAASGGTPISAEQVAYIAGLGSISAEQTAYIRGRAATSAEQASYIAGVGSVASEQIAYLHGLGSTSVEQVAFVSGHVPISSEQAAYIAGLASVSSGQESYIAGLGSISLEQVAYISGTAISVSAEQIAYIAGIGSISLEQAAYIRGHKALWKEYGMAVTKSSTQVTWSAASSVSVTAGGNQTSDAMTFDATSFDGQITLKADNAGTPAAGDTVTFYILYTTGDPDGAGADEYDTTEQGTRLCALDTNADDPAQKTVRVSVSAKGFKIYAVSSAATNSITVSAELYEIKASIS